jgi:hypothetical protein
MVRSLWQLLLKDPQDLTCDQCFAVMEYYAEVLARGGGNIRPEVIEHLKRCPHCETKDHETMRRLVVTESDRSAASLPEGRRGGAKAFGTTSEEGVVKTPREE